MRDDYLILAEAERFVGGDVAERRKRIQDAGKAGKFPHAREFAPELGIWGQWVQPYEWLLAPDWEHGRLACRPPGVEVRISRKDLADCFRAGEAAPEENRRGRKPRGETRDAELMKEIIRKIEAGEISNKRGERTAAAKLIQKEVAPSYEVDTIRRKITEELKSPRRRK